MSALKSRLAIGLTGFPLIILAVLNGGWIFNSIIVLAALIAFKEFLSLQSKNDKKILWILFGIIYVLGSIFCLLVLRDIDLLLGSYFTLMLFAGVSVNDSFSYIFGKWIGGKKIAPSISPNKTYAGLIGGLVSTILFVLLFDEFIFNLTFLDKWVFIIIINIVGFFGDIFESSLKRRVKIKDSSRLLMGHGGMLDRLDSLILTTPVTLFYVIAYYL
ncbi:MAG: phosphatidate cytidylyltransferase [Candidatus Marinimicrobia bacterium]|jgi:phosphatidate cytidylyltransferase|nr:phosphatidate cytidylyltransferase [Candidatus Neomarinimicrobiota bacterium]MBT3944060.1 phosphatidate cytidylyltransferase [Candidatus Neomarinimicrobiota bacterium]MBT4112035.1 phosphatidate cytidylyltransferase [Candidatus Neomarinimicrobiota bacterium]MBT4317236.1 phosphatidate cytidylyltransferase [Candidatus Neomarinimicrobiota bacterium]MBT4926357.1 phosphatidate cytidylyltransferase [Candidatus Neomarinimicrobiota bacterium]